MTCHLSGRAGEKVFGTLHRPFWGRHRTSTSRDQELLGACFGGGRRFWGLALVFEDLVLVTGGTSDIGNGNGIGIGSNSGSVGGTLAGRRSFPSHRWIGSRWTKGGRRICIGGISTGIDKAVTKALDFYSNSSESRGLGLRCNDWEGASDLGGAGEKRHQQLEVKESLVASRIPSLPWKLWRMHWKDSRTSDCDWVLPEL